MKKITFSLMAFVLTLTLQAQITYSPVLTEGFETANGFPANFNALGQQAWATASATKNAYPYTGTIWKDLYSNAAAADKTYSANVVAEERTGGAGSQCLKFNLTGQTFGTYETPFTLRLRSNNDIILFAGVEGLEKYEVTFWARIDGADKNVLLNKKSPNEFLTITSTWQKFTIDRYATGTGVTALGFDFYPLSDNTNYSVYIDDMSIKVRKIAYTSAASNITANSFTANWAAVEGANAYNVIVEKSDGAETPAWTAIAGSPFAAGNVQTLAVSNLDAGTYRYRVTATDGTMTTVESNNTFATTAASGLKNPTDVFSIRQVGNSIEINSEAGKNATLFNAVGQLMGSYITSNSTLIPVNQKGIVMVQVDGYTQKIMLK